MTDRISKKLRALFPGVTVTKGPLRTRGAGIVVTSRPEPCPPPRRAERVTLTFVAPTAAQARRMYLTARRALVSVGNETTVGDGADGTVVCETGGDALAPVSGYGAWSVSANFTATGY